MTTSASLTAKGRDTQTPQQKITPCLWFNHNAEAAINHYISIFKDGRIIKVSRYGEAGPGPAGGVMTALLELAGQRYIALNGGPHFKFTPAISLFVKCTSQQEVDEFWEKLTAGGGQPSRCGWLQDKYGLSWQIVPTVLGEMLQDKDREKAKRVMDAMMKMDKIDIAALKAAYAGGARA